MTHLVITKLNESVKKSGPFNVTLANFSVSHFLLHPASRLFVARTNAQPQAAGFFKCCNTILKTQSTLCVFILRLKHKSSIQQILEEINKSAQYDFFLKGKKHMNV